MTRVTKNASRASSKKIASAPRRSNKKDFSKTFTHKAKIYHIVWRDAYSEVDEWHDFDSVDTNDYLCETVGYLIENNGKDNYYTIASTMTQDDFFSCVINIPKAMVISKKRLLIK
jgi:hypothetical protein